jgi:hypothetical protein
MNILMLNGNPDLENAYFDSYIHGYQLRLHKMGHYVKTYQLREMKITGREEANEQLLQGEHFMIADDVRYIINSLKETDLLVLASPLIKGHISALTRLAQNKIIRYFQNTLTAKSNQWPDAVNMYRVPLIGLILQPESAIAQQEILLNKLIQERVAANLHTILSFLLTTKSSPAEAVSETLRRLDCRLHIEDAWNNPDASNFCQKEII